MIATYAEVRSALLDAADVLDHPTKQLVKRGVELPHRYGSSRGTVVYRQGGHVGLRSKGAYLVAQGENHELSAFALAHHLGLKIKRRKERGAVVVPDVGVPVVEIDEAGFRKFCTT